MSDSHNFGVQIVNVVGSGSLNVELDLERLATDLGESKAQYDPDKYPGMYLRFEEDAPLITVYRTGKFIITGADSREESYSLRERFLNLLSDLGVIEQPEDEWFAIQNYVCIGELAKAQNLNALAIGLGLEKTEYEPEQFPGLVYRPEDYDLVMLIFTSGKIVITGAKSIDQAEMAFSDLKRELASLL